MSEKNKKVGVLMGGLSQEREISLKSGRAVAAALRARGYSVTEIDAGRNLAADLAREKIEVAFIVLHGRFGEDGTVQGVCELMGIPYTGSGLLASSVAIDKEMTKRIIRQAGVRTPDWKSLNRAEAERCEESPLPLPVIVKPNREGSTIGMSIVREPSQFRPALREAGKYDETVIVEKFVEGREVTVALLKGKALPVLEVRPKSGFYDYRSKYTPGMTEYIVPAPIPESIRQEVTTVSEKIWQVLSLSGTARVDFMIDAEGQSQFLEVNTIPGMTETSLVPKAAGATGMNFEELCVQILSSAGLKG